MSPYITSDRSRPSVLAALLALAIAATPATGAGWLAEETAPGTFDSKAPTASADVRVALLEDGSAVALTATGRGLVELARRSPTTGAWATRSSLDRLPRTERARPVIAHADGTHVAAWTIDRRLWASIRTRGGRWSQPTRLAEVSDEGPSIAIAAGGVAVVAWVRDGVAEARVRERGRWTPSAPLSAGDGLARISASAAVIDDDGTASVGFVQDLAGDDDGPARALVATRQAGASGWTVGQLPGGDGDEDGPPALGIDAGGTLTAAWTSGDRIEIAVRTASSAWEADSARFLRSEETLDAPILVIEASGRSVLAGLAGGAGVRRLAVRDGPAEAWTEVRTTGSPGTAAPVAATITGRGDAIVVFTAERVGGCRMEILTLPANRDTPVIEARPAIGCEPLSLAVDEGGDAVLAGTTSRGVRSVSRPVGGLTLSIRAPGPAPVGAGRLDLAARASAPSAITVRVRRPGGPVVRRLQVAARAGASTLRVDLSGLAAGTYQLLAHATSGGAKSAVRTISVRIS